MATTLTCNQSAVKKMNYNGVKVKKWYHDGVKVFSAGNVVTYYFNPTDYAQEEVDSEASVLTPKTVNYLNHFSGWTFVGWREDKTASSSVLSSKVMGDEPITLYAVYKRTLTASFNGNGATSGSVASISGTQYYNNGNTANPTITLPANGYARTEYAFTGWNYGAVGARITLTDNITVYAQWRQTVVRLVHNSALCSGVSMGVYSQNGYDEDWPPRYSGSTCQLWTDEDISVTVRIYFNVPIPAGKTVHVQLYAANYGNWGTYECNYQVLMYPTSLSTQYAITSQPGDQEMNLQNGQPVTYSYTNPYGGAYVGFRFHADNYGSSSRWVSFVVQEVWYDN